MAFLSSGYKIHHALSNLKSMLIIPSGEWWNGVSVGRADQLWWTLKPSRMSPHLVGNCSLQLPAPGGPAESIISFLSCVLDGEEWYPLPVVINYQLVGKSHMKKWGRGWLDWLITYELEKKFPSFRSDQACLIHLPNSQEESDLHSILTKGKSC